MTRQGRLTASIAVIGAGLMLASCNTTNPADLWPGNWRGNPLTSTDNVEALRRAAPPSGGGNFASSLSSEYAAFSQAELAQADYTAADYFARKGLGSARGAAPPPEDPTRWNEPPQKQGELAQQRQRLVAALDAGARERNPALAARAQGKYDCWVEQQEENWQALDIAECRHDFLEAMNELERPLAAAPPAAAQPAPPAAVREYRVYFEFDRSNLTPEAQQIIRQAADEVRRSGNARLLVVGKADRSGTDQYNQRLSERRARTVVDALQRDGVPRDRITSRAVGESQPPVPTPDGVREPRNRVVEITVQ